MTTSFMNKISNDIEAQRSIKDSTLKLYMNTLSTLHNRLFDSKEVKSLSFLKDKENVIEEIKKLKKNTQKSYLATIVVVLMSQKTDENLIAYYREVMERLAKEHEEEQKKQEKSDTQEKNWVTMKRLEQVSKGYKRELTERGVLNKSKDEITEKEFDLLQKWLVSSLYVIQAPLRNDYANMEVLQLKDYDKMTEGEKKNGNYLVLQNKARKFFSLGSYKTSGVYGLMTIDVRSKLNSVLNTWLKYNDSGHLLLNKNKSKMTPNALTKYIQKTFAGTGKVISSSLIRHIYISETLGLPKLKEREELAKNMTHSTQQQELYAKKD